MQDQIENMDICLLTIDQISAYNPHKYPPCINIANIHGKANRISDIRSNSSKHSLTFCPCCNKQSENQLYKLSEDPKVFINIGECLPIYFNYIKFGMVVLAICFFGGSSFNLYENFVKGSNCLSLQSNSLICQISLINVLSQTGFEGVNKQSAIISMLTVLLVLVFELYKKIRFLQSNQPIKSASQFSLYLKNLPENYGAEEIYEYLRMKCSENNIMLSDIVSIIFLQDQAKYQRLLNLKNDMNRKLSFKLINLQEGEKLIKDIDSELASLERNYGKNKHHNKKSVIVVLENFETALALKSLPGNMAFDSKSKKFFRKGNDESNLLSDKIIIKRAPNPSEIIWENLDMPSVVKDTRRFKTNIFFGIIFAMGFLILNFVRSTIKKAEASFILVYPSYPQVISIISCLLGSTSVALMNTMLGIIIRNFAKFEAHKSFSNYYISTGKRLSFILYLNMALTTLFSNMQSLTTDADELQWHLNSQSLIFDLFFLFITNSYMSSFFNFCDIMWGIRLWKRRNLIKNISVSETTQFEANKIFEGHPIDLALRWSNVNKTLVYTGTFLPLIPVGAVFSIVGLFICYWVDKYLLLRRYTAFHQVNQKFANSMFEIGQIFLVSLSFGNIIMFHLPQNTTEIVSISSNLNNNYYCVALFLFLTTLTYKFLAPQKCVQLDEKFISDLKISGKKYSSFSLIDRYENNQPLKKVCPLSMQEMKTFSV